MVLFGLFLQGFVHSLHLCWPLAGDCRCLTLTIGPVGFPLWLIWSNQRKVAPNDDLAWSHVDIHTLELTCPFGFLTFLRPFHLGTKQDAEVFIRTRQHETGCPVEMPVAGVTGFNHLLFQHSSLNKLSEY